MAGHNPSMERTRMFVVVLAVLASMAAGCERVEEESASGTDISSQRSDAARLDGGDGGGTSGDAASPTADDLGGKEAVPDEGEHAAVEKYCAESCGEHCRWMPAPPPPFPGLDGWDGAVPDILGTAREQCPIGGGESVTLWYPHYHGHRGCHMAIDVPCYRGWLVIGDDPVDPSALRAHEHRCDPCTEVAPCTNSFVGSYATGQSFGEGPSTTCQVFAYGVWNARSPVAFRGYEVTVAPRVARAERAADGSVEILYYSLEQLACGCTCTGVVGRCLNEVPPAERRVPYVSLGDAVELEPLELADPFELDFRTHDFASPDAPVEWCSILECLYLRENWPTGEMQLPPASP